MKPESSAASWLKFFSAAGIPKEEAENYAVTFSKNQIQLDMLPEIKKEYLKDMGITLMGHIIAILRHAKAVHADELKKIELSTSEKQSPSGSKPKSSKDSKTVSKASDDDIRQQSTSLKRRSTVVQLKHGDESKTKVRKKLCDSSDDVCLTANSAKVVEVSSRNLNYDLSSEEYKKGVFRRLGVETSNPESTCSINGINESVFARLGDKSLPQLSKEVNTHSTNIPVKRLVASNVINKSGATKSIIRTRLDNKLQRILVSPTYMDGAREERGALVSPSYMDETREGRGILISPTYMDGAREERDLLSRLNCNSSLEKRNIKARLGKTSQLLSGTSLPGTAKRVSFGSVYQKLIPREKKTVIRNGIITNSIGTQKGSIGLSTGVFSRLGKSFY